MKWVRAGGELIGTLGSYLEWSTNSYTSGMDKGCLTKVQVLNGSRAYALLHTVCSLSDWAGVQLPYIAYPRCRRYVSWPRPRTRSSLSQSRPRLFGIDRCFHRSWMLPSSRHQRQNSATARCSDLGLPAHTLTAQVRINFGVRTQSRSKARLNVA